MKKSLVALLLVATLLMSCVCSVSAATATTKDGFLEFCLSEKRDVVVPVDIEGKLTDGGTYADSITGYIGDEATFIARIFMYDVKNVVNKVIGEAKNALGEGSDEYNAFMALPVEGSFTISAEWVGVTPATDPADPYYIKKGALNGFKFDEAATSDIFTEGVTRNLVSSNKVEAKIDVIDKEIDNENFVTVADLVNLPDVISLEIGGFTIEDKGYMKGEIKGSTSIINDTIPYDIVYDFVQKDLEPATEVITPVDIAIIKTGTGSGASTTTFYTLTYVTADGETITDSVVAGKTVELTEVPERDGYAFSGWYLDAELTNKITSIVVNDNVTVYAGWTPVGEPGGEITHPVPDKLNGAEHFAYLQGYPDGTIRPTDNISRAEVATVFFRLLKAEVRQANLATTNNFADVSEDAWYNTAVSTMAKMGIINGRTATEFAPDENITRAEFAAICARFDEANESAENIFTDIDGHWAKDYILEAVAYKWIEGYENGTFRPDNFITRAEAATLINRVLVRLPEDAEALLEGMKIWPDNSVSAWYYLAIQEATNSHTYGRVDAVNEKWNTLVENTDWTVYEQ